MTLISCNNHFSQNVSPKLLNETLNLCLYYFLKQIRLKVSGVPLQSLHYLDQITDILTCS